MNDSKSTITKNLRRVLAIAALAGLIVLPISFGCGGGGAAPDTAVDGAQQASGSDQPNSLATGTPLGSDRLPVPGDRVDDMPNSDLANDKPHTGGVDHDSAHGDLWHGKHKEWNWDDMVARIEKAVEDGKLTREEADEKLRLMREWKANGGKHDRADGDGWHGRHKDWNWDDMVARIEKAVEEGKLTREEADEKLRLMRERMDNAGDRPHDGWNRWHGDKDRKMDLSEVYGKLGISEEALGGFKAALADGGIPREQIEKVLGAMLRIAFGMKHTDGEYILGERISQYLDELGLTDEQVRLVVQLSRRLSEAMVMPDRGHWRTDRVHDGQRGHDRGDRDPVDSDRAPGR